MPSQAVLVDLANRRFFFFWIEIWPHEFYFVAGLLIMAGIGLFLFTSALGRVWCGYTCPQTVWVDLFILVERWIEGDRNARVKLWNAKWDARKWRLRITKWAVWFIIAVLTGGAWVFYFADAPTLLQSLISGTAPFVAYSTIVVLAGFTLLFGGFMREQVCNYMCPWPRIQAAMMDENTITVGYRHWRGEPRGKHRKAEGAQALGDCIDCNACVNVCPAGIDIRDGQQLECITCALCIDACDDVMTKIGAPRGLIDYIALPDEANERAGNAPINPWKHVFRPRTILYTLLWGLIGVILVVALFIRPNGGLAVSPVRQPVYTMLSDGTIRNTYEISITNQTTAPRAFEIWLLEPGLDLRIEGVEGREVIVPVDDQARFRVYVEAPKRSSFATSEVTPFVIEVRSDDATYRERTLFNGKAD